MTETVKYVSLVRMRLDGELYRAGDIVPGLTAETAEPLIAAGLVVEDAPATEEASGEGDKPKGKGAKG